MHIQAGGKYVEMCRAYGDVLWETSLMHRQVIVLLHEC